MIKLKDLEGPALELGLEHAAKRSSFAVLCEHYEPMFFASSPMWGEADAEEWARFFGGVVVDLRPEPAVDHADCCGGHGYVLRHENAERADVVPCLACHAIPNDHGLAHTCHAADYYHDAERCLQCAIAAPPDEEHYDEQDV